MKGCDGEKTYAKFTQQDGTCINLTMDSKRPSEVKTITDKETRVQHVRYTQNSTNVCIADETRTYAWTVEVMCKNTTTTPEVLSLDKTTDLCNPKIVIEHMSGCPTISGLVIYDQVMAIIQSLLETYHSIIMMFVGVILIILSYPFLTIGRRVVHLTSAVAIGFTLKSLLLLIPSTLFYLLALAGTVFAIAMILKRISQKNLFRFLTIGFCLLVGFLFGSLFWTAVFYPLYGAIWLHVATIVAGIGLACLIAHKNNDSFSI